MNRKILKIVSFVAICAILLCTMGFTCRYIHYASHHKEDCPICQAISNETHPYFVGNEMVVVTIPSVTCLVVVFIRTENKNKETLVGWKVRMDD